MPDAAVGLLHHLDHALLDQPAGVFEPGLVEIGGDLDRLAPQKDASAERQRRHETGPRSPRCVAGSWRR